MVRALDHTRTPRVFVAQSAVRMSLVIAIAVLGAMGFAVGAALSLARSRLATAEDRAVDAVDALLPQIQCAQCGYPGCRPYAEAIVAGAAMDLCPPGGQGTATSIAKLLGREGEAPRVGAPTEAVARIDEDACIGCALCIEACPVDAIAGAHQYMHTVIESRCTGCELCIPPCPVDCISLIPLEERAWAWPRP